MDIEKINQINEEVNAGDFRGFDNLLESEKGSVMKSWDKEMKRMYLTRNPVMSEDDFFEIRDKIADGKYDIEEDKEILKIRITQTYENNGVKTH